MEVAEPELIGFGDDRPGGIICDAVFREQGQRMFGSNLSRSCSLLALPRPLAGVEMAWMRRERLFAALVLELRDADVPEGEGKAAFVRCVQRVRAVSEIARTLLRQIGPWARRRRRIVLGKTALQMESTAERADRLVAFWSQYRYMSKDRNLQRRAEKNVEREGEDSSDDDMPLSRSGLVRIASSKGGSPPKRGGTWKLRAARSTAPHLSRQMTAPGPLLAASSALAPRAPRNGVEREALLPQLSSSAGPSLMEDSGTTFHPMSPMSPSSRSTPDLSTTLASQTGIGRSSTRHFKGELKIIKSPLTRELPSLLKPKHHLQGPMNEMAHMLNNSRQTSIASHSRSRSSLQQQQYRRTNSSSVTGFPRLGNSPMNQLGQDDLAIVDDTLSRDGRSDPPPASDPFRDPLSKKAQIPTDDAVKSYLKNCQRNGVLHGLLPFITGHSDDLNARGRDLTDRDLQAVIDMLKQVALRGVDLTDNGCLSDDALRSLLDALHKAHAPELQYLSLKNCRLVGSSALRSLTALLGCQVDGCASRLQLLDLGGINIGVNLQLPLCKAIQHHGRLHELRLADVGLGDTPVTKQCLEEIFGLGNLHTLDLGWNNFSTEVCAQLSRLVAGSPSLKSLGLANTSLGSGHAQSLLPFLEQMHNCTSLTHLDVSVNQLDSCGALVLEDALEAHPALTELNVSQNPFGLAGMSSILHLLLRSQGGGGPNGGASLRFCICDGCFQAAEEKEVSHSSMNAYSVGRLGGRYELNLAYPHDRAVLRMLYKATERLGMSPNVAFQEVVARPEYNHSKSVGEGRWQPPTSGSFAATFSFDLASEDSVKKSRFVGVDEWSFRALLRAHAARTKLRPGRRQMLALLSWWRATTTVKDKVALASALAVDVSLPAAFIWELCRGENREVIGDVLWRLLPCLGDDEAERYLALLMLPGIPAALEVVRHGEPFLWWNPENPSGRYRLKLDSPIHYAVADAFMVLESWEVGLSRRRGRVDTAEFEGYSCFRNELYEEQPPPVPLRRWRFQRSGWLQFDYSTSKRPPVNAATLTNDKFSVLLRELAASELSSSDQLAALRRVSHQFFLSSVQLEDMMHTISDLIPEVVQMLFFRLTDVQNVTMHEIDALDQCRQRLGHVNLFPFMQPEDSRFELDFKFNDQRLAANLLLDLASKENMQLEDFVFEPAPAGDEDEDEDEEPPAEPPKQWLNIKEMPIAGKFFARYPRSVPKRNLKARMTYLQSHGLWALDPEQELVVRWREFLD